MLVIRKPGDDTTSDDPQLRGVDHKLLSELVETPGNAHAAVVGVDGDVDAVVPITLGVVVLDTERTDDVVHHVLGFGDVIVDEHARRHPHDPHAVENHECPLGEDLLLEPDALDTQQIMMAEIREASPFEIDELVGKLGRCGAVLEVAHLGVGVGHREPSMVESPVIYKRYKGMEALQRSNQ